MVAGNWKMNLDAAGAQELVEGIKSGGLDAITSVEKVVCPPFLYLPLVAGLIKATSLRLGAQDLHWEEKGAFTGEVSAEMLKDYAEYVIIGHSERRQYFGETDDSVNKKLKAALRHGLAPIVCVGETGEERGAGMTHEVLERQVDGALSGVKLPQAAVIAYEPVWAIGTGVAATPEDANEAIGFIRGKLASVQDGATAEAVRILYGGSVTPANIGEFTAREEVDGALVGGASLVAASFVEMVEAVAASPS